MSRISESRSSRAFACLRRSFLRVSAGKGAVYSFVDVFVLDESGGGGVVQQADNTVGWGIRKR